MFAKTFFAATAICSLLAPLANAHVVITSPVPYGSDTLNNSPLENDGSDFPCKQRDGVYDIKTMNQMPVGVPQKLAFMGGATHGGGSCQISVTLDKEPTKESQWKVIHSIIGGCPNDAAGNANGSPTYSGNPTFDFSIPKGMPNGEYTLAWTWFNKIGNREMYMNCAPIQVTGGADNNDVYDSLPDMFVINLPREECETDAMMDFVFPEPGLYVETYRATALGSKTTGANCAAATAKGAGAGNPGSPSPPAGYDGGFGTVLNATATPVAPSQASSYPAPTSQASPSASQAPSYSIQTKAVDFISTSSYSIQTKAVDFISTSVAPQGPTQTPGAYEIVTHTSIVVVTVDSPPPAEQTASPNNHHGPARYRPSGAPVTNSNTSSGSCSAGVVACENDGGIVCIGSDHWGKCNAGCAFPMRLTPGTSCSAGTITKRYEPHMRRHIRLRRS